MLEANTRDAGLGVLHGEDTLDLQGGVDLLGHGDDCGVPQNKVSSI